MYDLNYQQFMVKMLGKPNKAKNLALSPLLVSYRDEVMKEIGGFYSALPVDEEGKILKIKTCFPVLIRSYEQGILKGIFVAVREIKTVINKETREYVGDIENANSESFYIVMSKKERSLFEAKKKLEKENAPIPDYLLEVPSSLPFVLSEEYSDYLEDYILKDQVVQTPTINSFLDYVLPVVERGQFTIVKANVADFIRQNPADWLMILQSGTNSIIERDIKQTLLNYLTSCYEVYSILSATKRGDKLRTSELWKSCSEVTDDVTSLYTESFDNVRISNFDNRLPLFDRGFMTKFLFGYIPMFTIYTDTLADNLIDLDIFRVYKLELLRKISELGVSLADKAVGSNRTILRANVEKRDYYIYQVMRKMYVGEGTLKAGNRPSFMNNTYSHVMVDSIVYAEALSKVKVKERKILDFIKMISPIDLDVKGEV